MTCYKFECSQFILKNPLQDLLSSLNDVILTGHVIYNPAYTYKFKLKTTKDTTNHTIKMTLNENSVVADLMAQMSAPKSEEFLIPVPNSDRQLRAKFYYPPELRKDEFIKFPLILHV